MQIPKKKRHKFGRFRIGNRVGFVGWLDGWMVKKFSSTLRIEMDPRPELREVKSRSARNHTIMMPENIEKTMYLSRDQVKITIL